MPECHSDPQTNLLFPWALDSVESTWNRLGAEALGFRTWTAGKSNSRSKAAARLTYVLRDNAHWLGGSRHTDLDVLLESFIAHLMASLIRIKQQGIERINEQTGSEMNARLTFWRYLDPDLRAMKHLSDQQLGITDQDNVEDIQRRRDKATLLREFASEVKSFTRQAAYLAGSDKGSNQKLEMALEIARQAMEQGLEDLKWTED